MDDWATEMDRLAALGELVPDASYRSSARAPLEGRWVGTYLTTVLPEPFWMTVDLRTSGPDDATVQGAGVDPVGDFTVEGWFDRATGELGLEKSYVRAHSLRYAARFDGTALRGAYGFGGPDGGLFVLRREAALPEATRAALPERLKKRHAWMNVRALWHALRRSDFSHVAAPHRALRETSKRLDRWLADAKVWR